jgi:hypothetical protein
MSEANFTKLPKYGPKSVDANGSDTIYYSVPSQYFYTPNHSELELDTANFPVYIIKYFFSKDKSKDYRIAQLSEFLKLKPGGETDKLPLVFAFSPNDSTLLEEIRNNYPDIPAFYADSLAFIKNYLAMKPYFVLDGAFILIDRNRNIRGYFDGNYAGELKRMTKEYQHLILRDEQNKMIKENELEQKR